MTTLIEKGDNEDLTAERRGASFSVRALASLLYGGEQKLDRRNQIATFVDQSPDLQDPIPVEFMTREQRVDNAARKVVCMTRNAQVIDLSNIEEAAYYQNLVMARDSHPLGLHYVMFLPALQGQASDEQQEKWLPMAMTRAIIGTYAQTELGHGTNLRKLETRATYDAETEEFVLETPTTTACKWWPGNLGKSATHAVVVAQLWTRGQCHGPHPFIVQLRHLDTHAPLPGVTVGDIGPKLGMTSNDNGFLMFDRVRIPRDHMLMRNSQVLADGEYVRPAHAKLGYGTMVFVRSMMIRDQGLSLGMAATIAIRYSAVRRQGEMTPGQGEVKVLDYQTQQFRLLPELARCLAFFFAGNRVREMYVKVTEQLRIGDVELLAELHALTSGLKAVVSWEVARGIEQCRLACGGHGYSHASGFPELYTIVVGGCTYEGENIVMLLQVARFLVKAARQVRAGDANLAAITDYLGRVGRGRSELDQSETLKEEVIVEAFEHVARRKVFAALDGLDRYRAQGLSPEHAWNKMAVDLSKASRAHVRLYLAKTFLGTLRDVSDQSVQRVLRHLCRLYVLNTISDCAADFLEDGYLTAQQVSFVREGVYSALAVLRPDAVALVDSFHFRDRELRSVIGRRDGQVYDNLLQWAKQSELNKFDVLPSFHKYLGPMMKEARAKL